MYGGPLLSILTSPKKASATASSACSDHHHHQQQQQQQQKAEQQLILSADELLDNPWHYDCVVSPRLSSSIFEYSPATSNKSSSSSPSPPPAASSSSSSSFCSTKLQPAPSPPLSPASSPSLSKPHSPPSYSLSKPSNLTRTSTQPSSTYVSLASFIHNREKSSYGSSAAAVGLQDFSRKRSKSITPVLSSCRDRDPKSHITRADPSRIRSYSGCLAVD